VEPTRYRFAGAQQSPSGQQSEDGQQLAAALALAWLFVALAQQGPLGQQSGQQTSQQSSLATPVFATGQVPL
jgi:hypothetical protein